MAERRTHGTHRPRPSDLRGHPAIRPYFAARDLEGLAPDIPLERAVTAQVEVDPDPAIPTEAPRDRIGQAGRQGVGREGLSPGHGAMARLEGRVVLGRIHDRHAAPVPGDRERPDRRIDAGVGIGQPDLDEHGRAESRWGRGRQVGERRLDGPGGAGDEDVIGRAVHAVISFSSLRASASSIVRNRAIPRWTWALTVPSGLPSAAAASG